MLAWNFPNYLDQSRQRNQGLTASIHRSLEPRGSGGARRFPRVQLPRNPHAHPRRDAVVRARRGRRNRHRHQGDVHLRRPRRHLAHAAPGEHRLGDPRLHRAPPRPASRRAEALLHRPHVPPRAPAEGPLPPVLPDRRGGHRLGIARGGRRSDRDGGRDSRARRPQRFRAADQFGGRSQLPPAVRRAAARRS